SVSEGSASMPGASRSSTTVFGSKGRVGSPGTSATAATTTRPERRKAATYNGIRLGLVGSGADSVKIPFSLGCMRILGQKKIFCSLANDFPKVQSNQFVREAFIR